MICKDTKVLKNQILNKRQQLESLLSNKKVTSEEVLNVSRELDELIVSYQKLIYEEKISN
ncbi:MAG: Spo0E like sporulation regulatory protein [Clostridiales bacterium]|nr:Spo0E like sporulation regulatory protein [Clostridiales bacterium]